MAKSTNRIKALGGQKVWFTTERAKFLNRVLPAYYHYQWHLSKNAREFVKTFHAEGKREYNLHQKVKSLELTLESILDGKKNGLDGSVFLEDQALRPFDKQLIKYNISRLKDLKDNKVEKVRTTLKEEDDYVFTKSGKVKSGEESAHKFNEECLGSIINVIKRVNDSKEKFESLCQKHKEMYPSAKDSFVSQKRRTSRIVTELKSEV